MPANPELLARLATPVTTVRLSLHVLAASIWVGGQFTVAGLLPTVRSLGTEAPRRVAQAFGRLQWPAFGVLVATGIWNVFASRPAHPDAAWDSTLGLKIGLVLLAGAAAGAHQRSKSKARLAAFGAITGLASVGALVVGVVLAG